MNWLKVVKWKKLCEKKRNNTGAKIDELMLEKDDLEIRELRENDCEIISASFKEQGWNKPKSQYEKYLELQKP